ncbi:hypothetical protein ACS0TY_034187 [Phlomoides rotata]
MIGDGSRSFFWEENWTGEGVGDLGRWVEDWWEWSWRWRRSLLDRNIIYLNALNNLLDRYHLINGVEDSWKWRLPANGLYSTKDTYDLLLQNVRTPYINGETIKGFKLIRKVQLLQRLSPMHGDSCGDDSL